MSLLGPRPPLTYHTKEKLYFYTIRENNTSFRYAINHVNAYERAEEYQSFE